MIPVMKTFLLRFLLVFSLFAPLLAVHAEDGAAIRQRMNQRLPQITALKTQKIAGEDNRGFLAVRGNASAADQALIAEENKDRASAYELLASQTGSTADQVGRARAKKIADSSPAGVWIQADDGSWAQKK